MSWLLFANDTAGLATSCKELKKLVSESRIVYERRK